MNWIKKNDDTQICKDRGIKMEINYMRSHWAWMVTDKNDLPIGGSFLDGRFPDSEDLAKLLAEFCANSYQNDSTAHLEKLDVKTSEKFDITIKVSGIRAILISMILYEHTQKKEYASNEIQTDKEENSELNHIAKSILDQWGDFAEAFEK